MTTEKRKGQRFLLFDDVRSLLIFQDKREGVHVKWEPPERVQFSVSLVCSPLYFFAFYSSPERQ